MIRTKFENFLREYSSKREENHLKNFIIFQLVLLFLESIYTNDSIKIKYTKFL